MTKTLLKKLLGVALLGSFAAMPLMGVTSAHASVLFPHHKKHHHHHHHHHVVVVHHHH